MLFDPVYWMFIGPTILLALWAQMRVKAAFAKYSRVLTTRGYSGAEAAAEVMRSSGIHDVTIEPVGGSLSDHYDPRSKTLRLSREVYAGRSVAAVGVAAHEAGHAIQHARNYAPLGLRSVMVPMAGFGSNLAMPLIFIGFLLRSVGMIQIGIILFAAIVLFQLVTLPVEFNASTRARAALADTGIIADQREMAGVSSVLGAAAWTYVAAALSAVMTLLYFLLRFGGVGGDD